MTKREFIALCGEFNILPEIALENDNIRRQLILSNGVYDCTSDIRIILAEEF